MQKLSFSNTAQFFDSLSSFCSSVIDSADVSEKVTDILTDVKKHGDKSVLEYTRQFDGARITPKRMQVAAEELKAAAQTLTAAKRRAIRESIAQVKSFHKKTLPKNWKEKNSQGGDCR